MRYFTYATFLLTIQFSFAQPNESSTTPQLTVNRTSDAITIDGEANEEAWLLAEQTSPFVNKWPSDSGYAEARTEVKLLFDDRFLYVLARNYQRREDLTIQTLKRDQLEPFWKGDGFSIVLDPMNQRANGFLFGVNAGGAQLDGAITLTGSWSSVNENWDNKWFSKVIVHDDYWVTEMAIPFAALRFNESATTWGLNFIRSDMKRNVFSTWSRIPLQFNGTDLGHLGILQWSEPIHPERSRVTLIPYAASGYSRDHEEGEAAKATISTGLDAKVMVTSSLNLDLTYRPDFSNVDVDQQMTNVTRYSLLFPERRNFFLENADLFTNYGSWLVQPFFSRRVGLHDGDPVPIVAGGRLSGNLTNGLRVGVMDIQTEATDELSANNYFVTAIQQRVMSRSSIKLFTSNRQTTRKKEGDDEADFNRTYGAEFQYVSTDGKWSAYARGHRAATPEKLNDRSYVSGQLNYRAPNMYTGVLTERTGENYINDLGFVPKLYNYDAVRDTTIRIGHYTINPWFGYLIYTRKSKKINMLEPNTWSVINYKANGEFLERFTSVNLTVYFKNTANLFIDASNNEVNLPLPSEIIEDRTPLPQGRYQFTQYSARYSSDSRKLLNAELNVSYGGFYNGTRTQFGATVRLRRQPWGNFGFSYLQNNITLPGEYGKVRWLLIGPRAEVSLASTMWWTTFMQFNTQEKNFNINSRFQWRFRPMSDLFIVYSDNYTDSNLAVKNRGVVMKLTYWINL